jgi:hypothetical protein
MEIESLGNRDSNILHFYPLKAIRVINWKKQCKLKV